MSTVTKYFYKGENTDLIVFAASEELVDEYLKNPSIGKLSEVVELFEVFTPQDGRGAEGELALPPRPKWKMSSVRARRSKKLSI